LNAEQKFVSLNLPGMRYFPAPTKTKAAQKSGCCQVLLRFGNMLSLAQGFARFKRARSSERI
jgi:hypothetical protein